MSSHLTLQILEYIILQALRDELQSQTSSNMSVTSECRPCRVDQPRSSAFSVPSDKTSSMNRSLAPVNTFSRPVTTGVQPAPFTPRTPLQFSGPETGQIDIKRPDKSTPTLQAREQHIPLNPVQAVLQIPVEIADPSPASKARPSDTRKRQQEPALSRSMSAPFEVSTPQQKPNAVLQIPVELLWPTLGNISSDIQKGLKNSTPSSLPASPEVSSVESSQHENVIVEHNQSVKITEDVSPDAATAKIDMDNEIWVDDPSCLDLNQVKNNIQSETSKEFLHQKLHPGNESGENKDSDRSAIHDISHQLPSTCHNVQDKNSVESLTHSQTSSIGRIQEVSSVAVQQDSNVKPLGDQVLPVTDDQWLKTVNSSDSRTEILSFAGKTKVNNVSSDISATFPQRSESPQRTVTPDDVRRAISGIVSGSVPGGSATDFTNPSTEAADISEDKILENAPEDMEGPVLENQNSQDYDLKKASRQPIFEVLSGMLNSSTSDMTAEIDKEQVCSAAEEKAKDNNVTACHTNATNETHLPERVVDGKCTNAINKSTRNTVTKMVLAVVIHRMVEAVIWTSQFLIPQRRICAIYQNSRKLSCMMLKRRLKMIIAIL